MLQLCMKHTQTRSGAEMDERERDKYIYTRTKKIDSPTNKKITIKNIKTKQ